MEKFELGKLVLRVNISNTDWEFRIADICHLSASEYRANKDYNDNLGNYEPEKEKQTCPYVKIVAKSPSDEVILNWSPWSKVLSPHISKPGWSKHVFSKLKGKLSNWVLADL